MSQNNRSKLHLALQASLLIVDDKMWLAGAMTFIDQKRGVGPVFRAIEVNSAQVASAINVWTLELGNGMSALCHKRTLVRFWR